MRQERITKKPRRRTARQQEAAPLVLSPPPADVADAEELLAHIEQLVGGA